VENQKAKKDANDFCRQIPVFFLKIHLGATKSDDNLLILNNLSLFMP